MTDPAREMAELLSGLMQDQNNETGDKHLASKFSVTPWSQDFYRVIATIMDRLENLENIIDALPLDDDYHGEMVAHLHD